MGHPSWTFQQDLLLDELIRKENLTESDFKSRGYSQAALEAKYEPIVSGFNELIERHEWTDRASTNDSSIKQRVRKIVKDRKTVWTNKEIALIKDTPNTTRAAGAIHKATRRLRSPTSISQKRSRLGFTGSARSSEPTRKTKGKTYKTVNPELTPLTTEIYIELRSSGRTDEEIRATHSYRTSQMGAFATQYKKYLKGPSQEETVVPETSPSIITLDREISDLSIKETELIKTRLSKWYQFLLARANELKQYDSSIQGKNELIGLTLEQTMALDPERRELAIKILSGKEPTKKIEAIDLLVLPGYAKTRDKLSLILPVYLEDVEGATNEGLVSTLNDAAGIAFLESGLEPSEPLRTSLLDLARHEYSGPQIDYIQASKGIEGHLSDSGYNGIKVTIYEETPLMRDFKLVE
tara:strand:+ start:97 stop:1326 length:1230 start_codon:yes stop_codon:yes gene_type:complete